MVTMTSEREAWMVAERVTDPELPMLTLADLGVLRDVEVRDDGTVVVSITPTYSGCPALDTMRDDLRARLYDAGYGQVEVRTVLQPAWTTDWITDAGRRKLADAGIAPPGRLPGLGAYGGPYGGADGGAGRVPLTLHPPEPRVTCPQCGATDTEEVSRFGATACRALRRCRSCGEPFEHVKEI